MLKYTSLPLVLSLLLAACSSDGEDLKDESLDTSSAELSLCNPRKCGPALGMPEIICGDGSTGGPTGRCVRKQNQCGWEIRSCPNPPPPPPPTPSCSDPNACGPAPLGQPNGICEGSDVISGPTGRCLPTADGTCGWEVLQCPNGDATTPPVSSCSAPTACGPALGMPNYVCPNGTVAGPTGRCLPTPGGCGWEVISCN